MQYAWQTLGIFIFRKVAGVLRFEETAITADRYAPLVHGWDLASSSSEEKNMENQLLVEGSVRPDSALPGFMGRIATLQHERCRLWMLGLAAALLAFCGGVSARAVQPAFPLHTSGRFIVDSNGNRVHLNAAAWYGSESTDFVVAGLQVATLQSIVQQIKSQGFNAVRLPWSNQLYETNPIVGSYALTANSSLEGKNALTIMDQVVDALTSAGIMVVLDNHNSDAEWCCSTTDGNTLWYNTTYLEASWLSDWEGMAQRYQSNPLVIGVDLRNEPRGTATWGGSSSTDWHAAAERGGNAVLSVNPNLLVFVEGVNYALDLSGVSSLPVQLNVPNQVVYSAHDYGFDYSGLTGYSNYVSRITPNWGYLVSGSNPQPLWIGEFGTCNTATTCVSSTNSGDNGYWFSFLTTYLQQYGVDWSYWAINGTESTGSGRVFGAAESYGILNTSWNGSALSALTSELGAVIAANPSFALTSSGSIAIASPGQSGTSTVFITPLNGFTGTVSLSCSVSGGPSGASHTPNCTVPSSASVTGTAAASATVSVTTTGSTTSSLTGAVWPGMLMRGVGCSALACVFVLFIPSRLRRGLLSLFIVTVATLSLVACDGGSSGEGNSTSTTTAGTYTVTVTGSASGYSSVIAQIPVTVQ
jgi:endoglucanase